MCCVCICGHMCAVCVLCVHVCCVCMCAVCVCAVWVYDVCMCIDTGFRGEEGQSDRQGWGPLLHNTPPIAPAASQL